MTSSTIKPPDRGKDEQPAQVLFVDGHKVTIRYSREENPSAIKAIKATLLAGKEIRKG